MCCSARKTKLISRDREQMAMKGRSLLKLSEKGKRMSNIAEEQRWYNPYLPLATDSTCVNCWTCNISRMVLFAGIYHWSHALCLH